METADTETWDFFNVVKIDGIKEANGSLVCCGNIIDVLADFMPIIQFATPSRSKQLKKRVHFGRRWGERQGSRRTTKVIVDGTYATETAFTLANPEAVKAASKPPFFPFTFN